MAKKPTVAPSLPSNQKLLTCPIRGPLNAMALATDGLTATEEARRIDLIQLLIDRDYPPANIAVETVVLKHIGEKGRNSVRADVVVYDQPVSSVAKLKLADRFKRVILVAEVKRDQKSKKTAIEHQLEPALRLMPSVNTLGIYWDDVNQLLLTKAVVKNGTQSEILIAEDNIVNLPHYGVAYASKPIKLQDLRPAKNLMGVLHNLANIFRSHKINDEGTRYRETVKLILARYCDERAAKAPPCQLALQVLPGADPQFMKRVNACYATAATRYQRAKTLFEANKGAPVLKEAAMREAVQLIQGIEFTAASSEVMQQVFMSFVPAVFKKSLDQYFTPLSLIDAMVEMVNIGPNDTVADPAMGTADFLSAAMSFRQREGDDDIVNRLYGADADKMAFDLAIVNMILHRDGQSNFINEDSIEKHDRWAGNINVALCNPPFGEKSLEKKESVLKNYDLGHVWEQDGKGTWHKTEDVAKSQQLGILFIEKCFKLLHEGGRMAIILPEGYLCTSSYGYIRQWLASNLKILALVELPRRIFNRSDADLRANILVAEKLSTKALKQEIANDYPIYAELIRKVGFKMGKGFSIEPKRDPISGIIERDEENNPIIDSDFSGLKRRFDQFRSWLQKGGGKASSWHGARISHVLDHPNLDMKPRRLSPKATQRKRSLEQSKSFLLSEVADVLEETIDLQDEPHFSAGWRLVEGISIRAVEGTVMPHEAVQAWEIIEAKQRRVFHLEDGDIVVGLVRPERRNIGLLMDTGSDIVGAPDGVAIVRVKATNKYGVDQAFIFSALRSEDSRIQLWTESGGTSYGKLNRDHILNVRIRLPPPKEIKSVSKAVVQWRESTRETMKLWNSIGTAADRTPIVNSPMFGLEPE